MGNSDQKSIRAVMSGEAPGPKAVMLRAGLRIAEPFYAGAMRTRNFLYETRIFRAHDLGRPVIAFGNITTGGTGKTPLVRWAAETLRGSGITVGILSRGYGATNENPLGDELTMLQHQLNGSENAPVAIVADSDRVAGAAKLLSDNPEVRVILLDDAFQHRRAKRDLNVVLINATEPFGFGHVLPRGLLREPLGALRRADAIVLTHTNRVGESEISNLRFEIGRFAPHAPIYCTSHKLSGVVTPDGAAPLETFGTVKFLGFCGIGTPAAFDRDISDLGNRAGFHAFDDHHAYTAGDIATLEAEAKRAGADVLLTTEKDWVKIEPLVCAQRELPIWRVEMRIAFDSDHETRLVQQMLSAIKGGDGVKHRMPIWVKIVYTAFVVTMLVIYFPQYGPANCLWFCDVAAILTVLALWFENSLLASTQLVSMAVSQTIWTADFVSGGRLIGISAYMFNPSIKLYVRGLSTFHLWLPFLLIWMVARLGYDRRAPWVQSAICFAVLVGSYAFSDPRLRTNPPQYPNMAVNVNRVYGLGEASVQTKMPELIYLGLMCVGYPVVIYFPTHFMILALNGRLLRRKATPLSPHK